MADHEDAEHQGDDHDDEPQREWDSRATAPQSPYTGRDVAVGAVVALVGVLVTFGVPLLLL